MLGDALCCLQFVRDMSSHLWLIGLHSVVLHPKLSAGSAATFTDRWTDFMEGTGGPWWMWLGLNCLQCFGLACGRCFGKLGSDSSMSLTLSAQHC